jgi:hypothetical protein
MERDERRYEIVNGSFCGSGKVARIRNFERDKRR